MAEYEVDNAVLAEALENASPADRKDFTVAAIYFPGFHPTPVMESWFGFGWSEWELVKRAKPRFPGHRQPLEPLWGYYDESDPSWAAWEIDAAADHGIDAFIFDWYWYCGVEILNEALDRGFLQSANRERLKFAVMWANHTWTNVFPAPLSGPPQALLPIRHSLDDLDRVLEVWNQRYFNQPNYWKIDGKPWCSFFLLSSLIEQLGGPGGVGKAVGRMRRRAESLGLPGLHLGCFTGSPAESAMAKEIGFDHATTYNIVRSDMAKPAQPRDNYEPLMLTHVRRWREMDQAPLPYWPVVTHGWDVSPRNHPYEPWPPVRWNWPHGHVVRGNTPERFSQLVYACRRFLSSQRSPGPRVMVLNAWNEWTEGSYLAPTRHEGWQVLEALKAALA